MSDVQDWWRTSILEMKPGVIRYRGYAIEQLIGRASFAQMIWLMLRGELPARRQGELLDAALMAAVDHGPQAPSIAVARMAVTCGVGLNNAIASAVKRARRRAWRRRRAGGGAVSVGRRAQPPRAGAFR